jgi:hypothetical protein
MKVTLMEKVSEVINEASGNIPDKLFFGAEMNREYLLCVGKTRCRLLLLLDIEKVITASDIINLKQSTGDENKEICDIIQRNNIHNK